MDDDEILNELVGHIYSEFPKFSMKVKEDSFFMKVLSVLLFFNKNFMSGFVTVIGNTVYFPQKVLSDSGRVWPILAHEWIHLKQVKRDGAFLHSVKYLFPQVLSVFSVFSLLAVWFSSAWLWCLLFVVCLLPFPAYWRMEKEFEAYMMNVFIANHRGYLTYWYYHNKSEHFWGSGYYFMWPFKSAIVERFAREAVKVKAGEYDNKPAFKDVKEFLSK